MLMDLQIFNLDIDDASKFQSRIPIVTEDYMLFTRSDARCFDSMQGVNYCGYELCYL